MTRTRRTSCSCSRTRRARTTSPYYNENSLAKTPNLDALAKDSLAFTHAVPEAMPTGPARRALLTGVRSFPFRNYVPTKGLPVGPAGSRSSTTSRS